MMNTSSNISDNVKKKGVFVYKNFISESDIKKIKLSLQNFKKKNKIILGFFLLKLKVF